MIEIIILFFAAKYIGNTAERKGLKKTTWIVYTVIAWIIAEFIGVILGVSLFGTNNLIAIMLFGLFCAFGGSLFVHAMLAKKPDPDNRGPNDLL